MEYDRKECNSILIRANLSARLRKKPENAFFPHLFAVFRYIFETRRDAIAATTAIFVTLMRRRDTRSDVMFEFSFVIILEFFVAFSQKYKIWRKCIQFLRAKSEFEHKLDD